jgi:hypothetical protein
MVLFSVEGWKLARRPLHVDGRIRSASARCWAYSGDFGKIDDLEDGADGAVWIRGAKETCAVRLLLDDELRGVAARLLHLRHS